MKKEQLEALEEVLDGFLTDGRMFTSVEIANEVKRLGVWVRNSEVATYLRSASPFGIPAYNSTTINVEVDGGIRIAICYHLVFDDPMDYMPRDLKAITPDEFKKIKVDLLNEQISFKMKALEEALEEKRKFLEESA